MPIRKAFRMKVHPGCEEEYERRHRPVWAELAEVLRLHGVHSYSIFLDAGTQDLFAYVEVDSQPGELGRYRTDRDMPPLVASHE